MPMCKSKQVHKQGQDTDRGRAKAMAVHRQGRVGAVKLPAGVAASTSQNTWQPALASEPALARSASGSAQPVDSLCKQHKQHVWLLMLQSLACSCAASAELVSLRLDTDGSIVQFLNAGHLMCTCFHPTSGLDRTLSGAVTDPDTRKQYDMVVKRQAIPWLAKCCHVCAHPQQGH